MIEKKYIELINKDIDKEISPNEKTILEEYLNSNAEAKNLYEELCITESLLDKIPDKEPTLNLKKNILNSIDKARYSRVQKHSYPEGFIGQIIFQTKYKIAFSFTLGILAGLLIYAYFFVNPHTINNNDISGTIGLNDARLIKSIPVNTFNILGNVNIKRINDNLSFDFNIGSPDQYNLTLKYDPDKVKFENISLGNNNSIKFDSENSLIKFSDSGIHKYRLIFSLKNEVPVDFNLEISQKGNKVFEQEIAIKE